MSQPESLEDTQNWAASSAALDPFYSKLVDAIAEAMRGKYRPDSCIAATTICLRVLHKLKPKLTPIAMPVGVIACNLPMYQWAIVNRRFPEGAEFRELIKSEGFHSVGVDAALPDHSGGWNGHLVTLCAGHLLDPSAGQFTRPAKQITTAPVALSLPAGVEPETLHTLAEFDTAGLFYWSVPSNRRYVRSPDWNNQGDRHRDTIAGVVRAMKGAP